MVWVCCSAKQNCTCQNFNCKLMLLTQGMRCHVSAACVVFSSGKSQICNSDEVVRFTLRLSKCTMLWLLVSFISVISYHIVLYLLEAQYIVLLLP